MVGLRRAEPPRACGRVVELGLEHRQPFGGRAAAVATADLVVGVLGRDVGGRAADRGHRAVGKEHRVLLVAPVVERAVRPPLWRCRVGRDLIDARRGGLRVRRQAEREAADQRDRVGAVGTARQQHRVATVPVVVAGVGHGKVVDVDPARGGVVEQTARHRRVVAGRPDEAQLAALEHEQVRVEIGLVVELRDVPDGQVGGSAAVRRGGRDRGIERGKDLEIGVVVVAPRLGPARHHGDATVRALDHGGIPAASQRRLLRVPQLAERVEREDPAPALLVSEVAVAADQDERTVAGEGEARAVQRSGALAGAVVVDERGIDVLVRGAVAPLGRIPEPRLGGVAARVAKSVGVACEAEQQDLAGGQERRVHREARRVEGRVPASVGGGVLCRDADVRAPLLARDRASHARGKQALDAHLGAHAPVLGGVLGSQRDDLVALERVARRRCRRGRTDGRRVRRRRIDGGQAHDRHEDREQVSTAHPPVFDQDGAPPNPPNRAALLSSARRWPQVVIHSPNPEFSAVGTPPMQSIRVPASRAR